MDRRDLFVRGSCSGAAKQIAASVTLAFNEPMYARLAPSLLTLETDVDASIAAVAEIAA